MKTVYDTSTRHSFRPRSMNRINSHFAIAFFIFFHPRRSLASARSYSHFDWNDSMMKSLETNKKNCALNLISLIRRQVAFFRSRTSKPIAIEKWWLQELKNENSKKTTLFILHFGIVHRHIYHLSVAYNRIINMYLYFIMMIIIIISFPFIFLVACFFCSNSTTNLIAKGKLTRYEVSKRETNNFFVRAKQSAEIVFSRQ